MPLSELKEIIVPVTGGLIVLLVVAALVWALIVALRRVARLREEKAAYLAEKDFLLRGQQQYDQRMAQLKEQHAEELQRIHRDFDARRAEQQKNWEDSRNALINEFKNLAAETLNERSKQLKDDNKESMGNLLAPLNVQLQKLATSLQEADKSGTANSAKLEAVMREMMSQTVRIGEDAENLTKALKGESKTQGNWGEMILEKMLENSGLQRDVHYRLQMTLKQPDTVGIYRPDAVVLFPRGRGIVIDSKVSLTAYTQYTGAVDEQEKQEYLSAHVRSVRKHIDELAQKDYSALRQENVLEDTIGCVLMFMPNESGYIAAVQADPTLPEYAFNRKVLLVGPTNLGLALKLAHHLWLNEARLRNMENIFARAKLLYDKFAGFYADFEQIGKKIDEASRSYAQAKNKGFEGKGNFLWQCRELEKMGVQPRTPIGTDDEVTASLPNFGRGALGGRDADTHNQVSVS